MLIGTIVLGCSIIMWIIEPRLWFINIIMSFFGILIIYEQSKYLLEKNKLEKGSLIEEKEGKE